MANTRTLGAWIGGIAIASTIAAIACDADTGRRSSATADDNTEADPSAMGEQSGTPFAGESMGGTVPHPSNDSDDGGPYVPPIAPDQVEMDTRCCNVTLSIADPTGDETTARVVGDTGPLTGQGATLSYAGGRWSANVCLPLNVRIQYAFYFGVVASDAGDAGVNDYRVTSDAPTASVGVDGIANVYSPVSDCAAIDASAGMSH